MSILSDVKDLILKNLISILGFLVMSAAIAGIVQFVGSSILPALEARSKLSVQVNEARNSLVDARKNQNEPLADVQARLASAQTKLNTSLVYFLTDAQANDFINSLYQWAGESNVKITQVETLINNVQPTPTRVAPTSTRIVPTLIPTSAGSATSTPAQSVPSLSPMSQPTATKNASTPSPIPAASKDELSARIVRLQAHGASRQLVEFVSRIKDLSSKSIFITKIAISGDENKAALSLELAIYIAPYANSSGSGSSTSQSSTGSKSAALASAPTLASTDTPIPPPTLTSTPNPTASPTMPATNVPVQRYSIHVVIQGETINTIARQYGITVEAIRTANRMTSDEIRLAQQLLIPIR